MRFVLVCAHSHVVVVTSPCTGHVFMWCFKLKLQQLFVTSVHEGRDEVTWYTDCDTV